MAGRVSRELGVGITVAVALGVFALGVLAIGRESRMFVPKTTYWTRFDNTSGLVSGSPVRLVGVQIGTVEEVTFPTDLNENRIKVIFRVDRAYSPRIRHGSVAYLKSLSYLSQDKYIEITTGDAAQPELAAGEYVESGRSSWEETLEQSQSIADDVKEITSSLRDVLVAMNQGQGVVHDLIHDPEFGRQGVANLEASLGTLRNILDRLDKGEGLAGAMLSDRVFARKQLENIDASLGHLRSLLERADAPDGPIAQLTDPKGKLNGMLDRLDEGTAALSDVAKQVKNGDGLAGRLIGDRAYADGLLRKVDDSVGHLRSILKKIDEGQGSIGGLVNDPEVYESLKDIVAGIQKSRVGKGVVRHYGKKGAEARPDAPVTPENEVPPPPPNP
jgi:phospholipid/cholesterol/gamma-HCH transport system substrate-binding protein